MKIDLSNIPNDPVFLQKILIDLLDTLQERDRVIDQLKHEMALLKKQIYGPRSERGNPDQLQLFQAAEESPPESQGEKAQDLRSKEASDDRSGHGRAPLPEHLPREREVLELPVEERKCSSCGSTDLVCIGEETTSILEYRPSSFFVREHVRPKLVCKSCKDGGVLIADLPQFPIERGLPGPGLLAHVLTSKYADHLPLNRLEEIFAREQISISRSTMCEWVKRCAELLSPIYQAMCDEVVKSKRIHTDDTTVPTLEKKKRKTRTARFWVYVGDDDHPVVVYQYTPTRKRDGPQKFLDGFSGYLQADCYQGYNAVYADKNVKQVACWAHARRKFVDAQISDEHRSHLALRFIKDLYEVEKDAKGLPARDRYELRQARSKPVLEALKGWLEEERPSVLPKSPMGMAIQYALGHWPGLKRYVEDGDLAIDNNAAERALRCIAVGRKNWMFAGSQDGGKRAALMYSLIGSCKQHGVNPFEYLRDVLDRISTQPASRIEELFPHNWVKGIEQPSLAG